MAIIVKPDIKVYLVFHEAEEQQGKKVSEFFKIMTTI